MTFSDIFKSSFLENITSVSISDCLGSGFWPWYVCFSCI